jgi:hypothetical protein
MLTKLTTSTPTIVGLLREEQKQIKSEVARLDNDSKFDSNPALGQVDAYLPSQGGNPATIYVSRDGKFSRERQYQDSEGATTSSILTFSENANGITNFTLSKGNSFYQYELDAQNNML